MMVKKIVATVIYNIVFWGIFLLSYVTFRIDWNILAVFLYPHCMPLLFHIVYFVVIPKKDMETKWRVYQVFMQIMITVSSTIIVLCYIKSNFGSSGLMESGGVEFFIAFLMGVLSTIIYIPIRIGTAFLE